MRPKGHFTAGGTGSSHVTITRFDEAGRPRGHISPEELTAAPSADSETLWIDVESPDQAVIDHLEAVFALDPFAAEDSLHPHQRPKVVVGRHGVFIVAYGIGESRPEEGLLEHEIAMFVGPGYVITVRKDPLYRFEDLDDRVLSQRLEGSFGAWKIAYAVLDSVVDGYLDAMGVIGAHVDEAEAAVFSGSATEEIQQKLFDVRKYVSLVQRKAVPLRDVLNVMARRDHELFPDESVPALNDVYDHLVRVTETLDTQRDILTALFDAHLAIINNKMNAVMQKMTSWGAILLGATIITGVYGMNFEGMPELGWKFGYPFALGMIALVTLVLYIYFRRKKWI